MGAYITCIIRFPPTQIRTVIFFFLAIFCLGIWFFIQVVYGITSLGTPTNVGMEGGGIAYWAHAGGFVFGAILGPLLGLFSAE